MTVSQFSEHGNGAWMAQRCIALIGIGANLPGPDGQQPLETCKQAIAMLDSFHGMRVVALSRWFSSEPVPPSGQPPYVNAVALLWIDPNGPMTDASEDPAVLLARLMQIEAACGRQRSTPNAARTLDLDIISMGDLVRDAPDPILPHPRAHLRAFVLAPLAEVAPNWVHPVLGRSAAALLAELPPQKIRPL
jgi:2-amino-4-hydroxy-6-hydroxymethyldihydropteridine diphosphokinase